MFSKIIAAADISVLNVKPNSKQLPGTDVATKFVSGSIFYALLLVLVGVVLSAGLWAVGSWSGNYTQSINGKKGFLVCAFAALVIGGAYGIEAFFWTRGQSLK